MKILAKKVLEDAFDMSPGDTIVGFFDFLGERKTYEYTSDHFEKVNTMIVVKLDKKDRKKLKNKSKTGIFVGHLK